MASVKNKPALLILCLLAIAIIPSCAGRMSLEEARKVSISMAEAPAFKPPPRRINDILTILDQPGKADPRIKEKLQARADAKPPDTDNKKILKAFYRDRGGAALELGRFRQPRVDLEKALSFGINDDTDGLIKGRLAFIASMYGNFQKAIELFRESTGYPPFQSYSPRVAYAALARVYCMIGDLDAAKSARGDMQAYCRNFTGPSNLYWCELHMMFTDAQILEAQGKYAEAGELYVKIKRSLRSGPERRTVESHPSIFMGYDRSYARNLLDRQLLLEAEVESRQVLATDLALFGRDTLRAAQDLTLLSSVLLAQGRLDEAGLLSDAAVRRLEAFGTVGDSYAMGNARVEKGNILAISENFAGAMEQYDLARAGMKGNTYLYERYFLRGPMIILSMLMTGSPEEALKLASRNYDDLKNRLGSDNGSTAEMLALRGMAQKRLNRLDRAVQDLSAATDALMLRQQPGEESIIHKTLRRLIIEDFIDLLAEIQGGAIERGSGLNAAAQSFKLAQANLGRSVHGAVVAGSARAAATDRDLADLIRREQDAGRQILAMETSISDLLAAPAGQRDEGSIQRLKTDAGSLRRAREAIMAETKKRFPRYYELVNPSPLSLEAVRGLLRPGEALLLFYTTRDRTFAWAVPREGEARFAAAGPGRNALAAMIAGLRKSLDPNPQRLGDIPDFDAALAHDLYRKLFSPVEPGLNGATDLLIIANSPLDQIPFAVLLTAPLQAARDPGELFSRYRQAPWLIRKFSITMEPSVTAFASLRMLPPGDPARKAFIGFGDPLFNRGQLASAKTGQAKESPGSVRVRGVRVTAKGGLDNHDIASVGAESLNRLPDTAVEIETIAGVLNADREKDIFLRERASRRLVKTTPLSDRKVIAFATHALVPGDVDGLDQPALALSSPLVTGDSDDGLLTMTDIMKLKLNADWIILSACSTGAASGGGAEALSGLGQAFFYGGSRALLASMYPVETTSARKLVTGLFTLQAGDPRLTRAQALRMSMLGLIDREPLIDGASGRTIACYAHPLFWAPFVIVGDPGGL